MKLSVIAIGDELLIGQVTDTNSGFIARHIQPAGWEIDTVQVVGDNASDIRSAINRAFERTDVVLTTGGLGPTKDDITKPLLADIFGCGMHLDESVLDDVRQAMAARGRKMNELTAAQAMVPDACTVIHNPVGTAPIMWFERDGKVLVAMPGVPFEMQHVFTTDVFPRLLTAYPSAGAIDHRTLIIYGISESDLAGQLSDFEDSLPTNLHLAYLPGDGLIRLRLDGCHPDSESLQALLDDGFSRLQTIVAPYVVATSNLLPAEILLGKLYEKHLTVATAESCTGGNIAHLITEIPGSSAAMLGGVVAYSNEVKMALLGVRRQTLDEFGAVSVPVVEQMATGVCHATGASVGIATSGIAGPSGAVEGKPVGTVCIAVATPHGVNSCTMHFPGARSQVIRRASIAAIMLATKDIDI